MLHKKNQNLLCSLLCFTLFFFFSASSSTDLSILLSFKSYSDASNSLSSWSDSNPCSAWLGVVCHPTTNRTTKLVLNNLNLTGSIHILAHLTQLRHLSLHHNRLSSVPSFTSWTKLKHLYLSHNHFTGNFPSGVSLLRSLRRLDLSYNEFSGEIPVLELSRLPYLITLRLESNWFVGSLGPEWSSLSSLSDFNVSENGIRGKIPVWLSRFPASSFAGNSYLCGRPLPKSCVNGNGTNGKVPLPIGVTDVKEKKTSSRNDKVFMIITIDAVGALLMILAIGFCCYYKKNCKNQGRRDKMKRVNSIDKIYYGITRGGNEDGEMVCFEGCKGFNSVDDLLKASAEMLGKGSIGTTYKVVMDSGDVLVVKRMKMREKVKKGREIDGFLRVIGGFRHPNVVNLRAYYTSKEEFLLVSDFLPNGSLHNLLHGNRGPGRTPLDWSTRLKYALGSAEGLAFVHGCSKTKILHGHLTSSNIIIDQKGNACISDIGLHQLLQVTNSSNNGYIAPELLLNNNAARHNYSTRKYTQKCDVYSFGVVLLEILTGKMVTSEGETSLASWVQKVASENWSWDVFDFELVRNREMEEEMMALLKVAMYCLASSPKDRPKMAVVRNMIEDIRPNLLNY